MRTDQRKPDMIRPVRIVRNFIPNAEGSVLIEMGYTRAICTASVDDRVPPWMKDSGRGWITAEYGMLPRSTLTRTPRDRSRLSGRTSEIQRLIGRSLRAVTDLTLMGERTITMDCDVIQADGGTRTACITGAAVALADAFNILLEDGKIERFPMKELVAAISVGIFENEIILDLTYEEDSLAQVDLNVVMTGTGKLVEIQGTSERGTFDRKDLLAMLDYAEKGIGELSRIQKEAITDIAERWL
ncbi:MAG: ribonuclease PH [Candidatus Eremiobacteraeota bacterium]|nr:ribonuclease PH [Candidatus Eremiobacteraeota bacterium]